MVERLTDRGYNVMVLANQVALTLHQECVDTEHILLGLIK
jgi:hypothetical protein